MVFTWTVGMSVLVYSSTTAAQTNMRTKGDFRRCTMQKRTSKVCIYILPYSKNDAAVI